MKTLEIIQVKNGFIVRPNSGYAIGAYKESDDNTYSFESFKTLVAYLMAEFEYGEFLKMDIEEFKAKDE